MRRFILSILTIGLSVTFLLSTPAFADETINHTQLQISPVSQRVVLTPKDTYTNTFKVENTSEGDLEAKIYATSFVNLNDSSTLGFELKSQYSQISNWISFLNNDGNYSKELSLKLAAGENQTITYKITAPGNAPGGGQYATIFAESIPDDEQGIVTSNRVGLLLYANVKGETHTGAIISNIKANQVSIDRRVGVNADVENTGNIDFQASIKLEISTLFDSQLHHDTATFTILPESQKAISLYWDKLSFGLFKLHYTIEAPDQIVDESCIVLVLPIYVIAIALFIIVFSIIAIVYFIKKRKSTN